MYWGLFRGVMVLVAAFGGLAGMTSVAFAEKSCDTVLFNADTSFILSGRGKASREIDISLKNMNFPSGRSTDVFMFRAHHLDELKVRFSQTSTRILEVKCPDYGPAFYEVSKFDLSLRDIAREKAQEKLSKYKRFRYLTVKDESVELAKETRISKGQTMESLLARQDASPEREVEVARKEEFKVPRSEPRQNVEAPKRAKNRHAIAVVIGNRDYKAGGKGVPDVLYAANDARAIKQYLLDTLGYREGNIIYLEDASQSNLITTFGNAMNPKGQLYDWVRPGQSDVFIFYSGHGAPSLSNGKGYLLPIDADPQRVGLSGYSLETLYHNLAQVPAKSMTVVLDACFSGGSQDGTVVKNASSIALKVVDTVQNVPGATVLSASSVSEVASWDEARKHGLFTRYFLDGVRGEADRADFGNGDGKVTLGELKAYLESEVTYSARRKYGRDQHPQVSGNASRVMADLSPGQE